MASARDALDRRIRTMTSGFGEIAIIPHRDAIAATLDAMRARHAAGR